MMNANIPARVEKLLMVLLAILFAAPLPLTVLAHLKPLKKTFRLEPLAGVQIEQTYTPFSWSAVFDAKCQESLARFFDNEFFGRVPVIRLTNELCFRLFKSSSPADVVCVGK